MWTSEFYFEDQWKWHRSSSLKCRWFHKNVLRKEAERVLLNPSNPRGTFLVRNSENAPGLFIDWSSARKAECLSGPYSLSVRDYDDQRGAHVKHYKIRYSDPNIGYYIAARRAFPTLDDLINYYTSKREFFDWFSFRSVDIWLDILQKTLMVSVVH